MRHTPSRWIHTRATATSRCTDKSFHPAHSAISFGWTPFFAARTNGHWPLLPAAGCCRRLTGIRNLFRFWSRLCHRHGCACWLIVDLLPRQEGMQSRRNSTMASAVFASPTEVDCSSRCMTSNSWTTCRYGPTDLALNKPSRPAADPETEHCSIFSGDNSGRLMT